MWEDVSSIGLEIITETFTNLELIQAIQSSFVQSVADRKTCNQYLSLIVKIVKKLDEEEECSDDFEKNRDNVAALLQGVQMEFEQYKKEAKNKYDLIKNNLNTDETAARYRKE